VNYELIYYHTCAW